MNSFVKLILNTLSLLAVVLLNCLSNTDVLNSSTIGELSSKYDTLIAPAGYAFSIWGIIYLLLILFLVYQWYGWLKKKKDEIIRSTGIWFAIANFANASWVMVWVNEYTGLSVLIMLLLLFSLIQLIWRLKLEIWDAPLPIITFVWWPVCIYIGWIVLATVTNIAAFLVSIEWRGAFFSEETWTVFLILISTVIYALLIYKRNMREAALVGVWGLAAIAYRQWEEHTVIVIASLAAAIFLFFYTFWHGYKNRATSPINKWKNRKK